MPLVSLSYNTLSYNIYCVQGTFTIKVELPETGKSRSESVLMSQPHNSSDFQDAERKTTTAPLLWSFFISVFGTESQEASIFPTIINQGVQPQEGHLQITEMAQSTLPHIENHYNSCCSISTGKDKWPSEAPSFNKVRILLQSSASLFSHFRFHPTCLPLQTSSCLGQIPRRVSPKTLSISPRQRELLCSFYIQHSNPTVPPASRPT